MKETMPRWKTKVATGSFGDSEDSMGDIATDVVVGASCGGVWSGGGWLRRFCRLQANTRRVRIIFERWICGAPCASGGGCAEARHSAPAEVHVGYTRARRRGEHIGSVGRAVGRDRPAQKAGCVSCTTGCAVGWESCMALRDAG